MSENLLEEKSAVQSTEQESLDPSRSGGGAGFELLALRQSGADPLSSGVHPADVLLTDVWIVDSGAPMVFQCIDAASRLSGGQTAGASFDLTAGNTSLKEIADPPMSLGVPLVAARSDSGDLSSVSGAFSERSPSNGDVDSLFTALAGNFDPSGDGDEWPGSTHAGAARQSGGNE